MTRLDWTQDSRLKTEARAEPWAEQESRVQEQEQDWEQDSAQDSRLRLRQSVVDIVSSEQQEASRKQQEVEMPDRVTRHVTWIGMAGQGINAAS